jgi:hypothetical protein
MLQVIGNYSFVDKPELVYLAGLMEDLCLKLPLKGNDVLKWYRSSCYELDVLG